MDWLASYDFRTVPGFLADRTATQLDLERSTLPIDIDHPNPLQSPHYAFRLPHEYDVDPTNSFDDIRARYARRIERLWNKVRAADLTLFLRTLNDELLSVPEDPADVFVGIKRLYDDNPELMERSHFILFSTPRIEQAPKWLRGYPVTVIDNILPFEQGYIGKVSGYDFDEAQTREFYRSFLQDAPAHLSDLPGRYRELLRQHRDSIAAAAKAPTPRIGVAG